MKKRSWINKIKAACEGVGTYKPEFDSVIETLATILQERDEAMEQYIETGSNPVVTHTNKAGAKNYVKNPCLSMWCELNRDALSYWKELGLTPSGLRKIDSQGLTKRQESKLTSVLNKLDFDD